MDGFDHCFKCSIRKNRAYDNKKVFQKDRKDMSNIEVKNLCKSYDEKQVLNNFSAVFQEGKITCVMAPSGYGKTTLLRIIAGLEKQDSGEIINDKKISFVFQEDRLSENFNMFSNVRFVTGKEVSDEKIMQTFKSLDLNEGYDKPVKLLSGGMKRRVALARGLLAHYDLLIMDEPFKGLDENLKYSVMDYLKEATKNKTVICVTHDLSEAEYFADNIKALKKD